MAGTQAFEEMEVTEHFWLLSWFYNRFSLKDASKTVTIFGIIVGIIILVVGASGSFLIAGLYHSPSTHQLVVAIGLAVAFLFNGTGLLIYNILLLKLVKKNDAGAVFKIVKLGCLILLFTQLFVELMNCVVSLILLADPDDSKDKDEFDLKLSHNIAMLVSGFLGILLTLLAWVYILPRNPYFSQVLHGHTEDTQI